jgi:hypothetical protein
MYTHYVKIAVRAPTPSHIHKHLQKVDMVIYIFQQIETINHQKLAKNIMRQAINTLQLLDLVNKSYWMWPVRAIACNQY